MITKYYKTVSPNSAKNRIAKLVKKSNEAWDRFYKISKWSDEDSYIYIYARSQACALSNALQVMGIVEDEYQENL